MSRILVTGAGGFVGGHLCVELVTAGLSIRAAVRSPLASETFPAGVEQHAIGSIGPNTDWRFALSGVDAVVHLAARVHIFGERGAEALAAYREVNVEGTRRLARECVRAGVRRIVLLSSIKAVGERTRGNECLSEDHPCQPVDPYGMSKYEAERAMLDVVAGTMTETVILRAPLIYGPRVRANFLSLLRLIDRGIPLPLRSIRNRRSLLFVKNLTDVITRCLDHPAASCQLFHLADTEAPSTGELARLLGELMKRKVWLFPVPLPSLRLAGMVMRKSEEIRRLTDSLLVSTTKIRRQMGWTPPFTLLEGLRGTVGWYRSEAKSRGSGQA